MLGVECYGGGLWHTWLDRDLGISGRVLVRENRIDESSGKNEEKVVQKFVKISRPIARVSSLCIHLKTVEERKSLTVNKETHLNPILGTAGVLVDGIKRQLTGNERSDDTTDRDNEEGKEQDFWKRQQDPLLLELLATELGVKVKDIADFELNLFDTQPACLGGIKNEFLYSARLDNQATCFVAIESLIAYTEASSSSLFENDSDISMVCLFDHEEVGSGEYTYAGMHACIVMIDELIVVLYITILIYTFFHFTTPQSKHRHMELVPPLSPRQSDASPQH
jgi:aspartyl aminopeptidase